MFVTQSNDIFKKYTDEKTFSMIEQFETVSQMWQRCQSEFADRKAIEDNGISYTYQQIEEDASYLRNLIVREDDNKPRIGLLAANSYDFVKGFIAITTLGYTAVVLPAFLDQNTVFGCSFKFNLTALLYADSLADKTEVIKLKNPNCNLISLSQKGSTKVGMRESKPEDGCVVMFTGGTTGQSKGALLNNKAVMQGVINGCYGYHDVFYQRYILVLPLSHVFGLIRNLLTSLYTGSDLWICRNNQNMFKDIAIFKPTIFVAVPALAQMALNLSKKFGRNMLGEDMKYIICGAAAVAPYLVEEYNKFGITLFPGYGLTESANLVSGNPESLNKPESVGIPYPNQQMRIEDGELWLKGDNMMDGYVGEDNSLYYEDGWFKTGDLVRIDDEGFLYIVGRNKEIIVLANGENVSPAEVEKEFNRLSFIQDSQVFEDVNENGDHILALEVVLREPEMAKLQIEDKNEYVIAELNKVNKSLPAFQQVSRIEIRKEDFVRTPAMKIVRYKKCA